MGCLTYVFNDDGVPITCIRRLFDSGPGEMKHGGDLVRLLSQADNGEGRLAGPEELAALLVMELKEQLGPGGILTLLPPVWPPPNDGQDYEYFVTISFPDGRPLACYRRVYDPGNGEYGELVPLVGGQEAVTEIGAIITGADLGDVQGAAPPNPESPIALLDALRRAAQSVIDVTRVVGRLSADDPQGTSELVLDIRAKLYELTELAKWAEEALQLLHLVASRKATMPSGYRDRYSK